MNRIWVRLLCEISDGSELEKRHLFGVRPLEPEIGPAVAVVDREIYFLELSPLKKILSLDSSKMIMDW